MFHHFSLYTAVLILCCWITVLFIHTAQRKIDLPSFNHCWYEFFHISLTYTWLITLIHARLILTRGEREAMTINTKEGPCCCCQQLIMPKLSYRPISRLKNCHGSIFFYLLTTLQIQTTVGSFLRDLHLQKVLEVRQKLREIVWCTETTYLAQKASFYQNLVSCSKCCRG